MQQLSALMEGQQNPRVLWPACLKLPFLRFLSCGLLSGQTGTTELSGPAVGE
jgi:hypothetical protein